MDADFSGDGGFRVVQLTPPGSACSVIFGSEISSAAAGFADGLHLVVTDIEAARADLVERGVEAARSSMTPAASSTTAVGRRRVPGPAPEHKRYGSFASFSDPDGNGWFLQEITTRPPGR